MNRRGFLSSILAAGIAPAFVKAEILMPVRKVVWTPPRQIELIQFGDVVYYKDGSWNKCIADGSYPYSRLGVYAGDGKVLHSYPTRRQWVDT